LLSGEHQSCQVDTSQTQGIILHFVLDLDNNMTELCVIKVNSVSFYSEDHF